MWRTMVLSCSRRFTWKLLCIFLIVYLTFFSILNGKLSTLKIFGGRQHVCPLEGKDSSQPANHAMMEQDISRAIEYIAVSITTDTNKNRSINSSTYNNSNLRKSFLLNAPFEITTIVTSMNAAAAKYHFPLFLNSIRIAEPRLLKQLIIYCLDDAAYKVCAASHVVRFIQIFITNTTSTHNHSKLCSHS